MTTPRACPWCRETVMVEPDDVLGRWFCAACGRLFRQTDTPIPRMDDAPKPVEAERKIA